MSTPSLDELLAAEAAKPDPGPFEDIIERADVTLSSGSDPATVAAVWADEAHELIQDMRDEINGIRGQPAGACSTAVALEQQLAHVLDQALLNVSDAKAGEQYYAETNQGAALMAEQTRRWAWEEVIRLVGEQS